jgi:uncharacterized coiled-coil protein SlyX
MTIEERMDRLEKAWGSQDDAVRELRDAVTVTAQLEARQGRVLKEHGEWLAQHELAVKEHAQFVKEHKEAMKELDVRIANLVSGFGEFMRRERPPRDIPPTGA